MMRSILLKLMGILFLPVVLFSCQHEERLEKGVSLELARYRKEAINNLKYDLFFNIPQEKQLPIWAEETISFDLAQKEDVIIDFRESQERIKLIEINGEEGKWQAINEHIVLPAEQMKKGTNEICVRFMAGEQSLNRREDYLYTLFVPDRARTVFPCIDQPDLKAEFSLSLEFPEAWKAVANGKKESETLDNGRRMVHFAQTKPISTYLFAFAVGAFQYEDYSDGERTIGAYYRETDTKRIAQLPDIFKQIVHSLNWQEEFTGVPYPFEKYDFVILPGFQFGGMEHAGATFYNERIFLSEKPTPDEIVDQAQLIAHETSHMWFGDYVTMEWFDDVWTKEVFANYFAMLITKPLFPEINHDLNWLKLYAASAMDEDRTSGGTAIRQPLDNLCNAGLIYNNIIYCKAPVMMRKMVELMGEEAFQKGIQQYLSENAYGNATWNDLVDIFDSYTPHNLKAFSDVWVNNKGMSILKTQLTDNDGACTFQITQSDPYKRGLLWPQRFAVTLKLPDRDTLLNVVMNIGDAQWSTSLPRAWKNCLIKPNSDGQGYGLFVLESNMLDKLLARWQDDSNGTERYALLLSLHENYLAGFISDEQWCEALIKGLKKETDQLTASTLCSYLHEPLRNLALNNREAVEISLLELAGNHSMESCRTGLLRLLSSLAVSQPVVDSLYSVWTKHENSLMNIDDYIKLSYELSIRKPLLSTTILEEQRSRIENADRLQRFDFVSRAVCPDTTALDSLFLSLLQPENRRIEPWTAEALSYLNHPLRDDYSVKYIRPGLDILQQVQLTGDIFFPGMWCRSLLRNHRSRKAYEEVLCFLDENPDYQDLLKNKILVASFDLFRLND